MHFPRISSLIFKDFKMPTNFVLEIRSNLNASCGCVPSRVEAQLTGDGVGEWRFRQLVACVQKRSGKILLRHSVGHSDCNQCGPHTAGWDSAEPAPAVPRGHISGRKLAEVAELQLTCSRANAGHPRRCVSHATKCFVSSQNHLLIPFLV